MRLKIFFAPLVFLIAGVIAIWYVWPTILEIQTRSLELSASKDKLNSTLERKDNLETLKGILDRNKEKEDFILSYLPSARNEEKIVDGLNYLATDSGLSLINIAVEEERLPLIQDELGNTYDPNNTASLPEGTVIPVVAPQTRFLIVKANTSGKYENVKMFLNQVYRMEMLNKVNSLEVKKVAIGGAPVEGEQAASDTLTATVEIKFGYLPSIHEEGESLSPVFSSKEINFSQYQRLKDFVTEKIPDLDEGQKGKSNPFLP